MQSPAFAFLSILAIFQAAPPPSSAAVSEYVRSTQMVFVNSVATKPTAHLNGVIVRVQRAATGSGVYWLAHALSIQTEGGLRDAYVTSLDPEHDVLPRVGERCDLQYRLAETSAGPGLLVGRMWCSGRELR